MVVAIMNKIIMIVLFYTSEKEKSESLSEMNETLITKYSVLMFLNAGVFIVAANILADLNNFNLEGNFSNEVTQIMILNSVTPIVSLIALDYFDIFGRIKRWLVKKNKFVLLQI